MSEYLSIFKMHSRMAVSSLLNAALEIRKIINLVNKYIEGEKINFVYSERHNALQYPIHKDRGRMYN